MKIIKHRQINNLAWISLENLIKNTCLRIEFRHREGYKMLISRCNIYIYIYVHINKEINNYNKKIFFGKKVEF